MDFIPEVPTAEEILNVNLMAVAIERLGGSVEITQKEIEELIGSDIAITYDPDNSKFILELRKT